MNTSSKKSFNYRAFIALSLLLSGIGLPVTGIALAVQHGGTENHSWAHAHAIFALVFTVFAIWHLILNWRPLIKYIRISREVIFSIVIIAVLIFIFVGHGSSNH